VVLSKPSGMVCYHGGGTDSGKGNRKRNKKAACNNYDDDDDESLEKCLLASGLPLSTLNREGRGLVHRIDRGTSGCIVLAKSNRMHARLLAQFFLRRSKKSYRALVCSGSPALSTTSGEISCRIDGRPAKSRHAFEERIGNHLTRIRVETEQGRRHQVRKHCTEGLNAPILLDPLYGGQSILSKLVGRGKGNETKDGGDGDGDCAGKPARDLLLEARDRQRFCLHASTLVIPEAGIDVEDPLPEWWQRLEERLGEEEPR